MKKEVQKVEESKKIKINISKEDIENKIQKIQKKKKVRSKKFTNSKKIFNLILAFILLFICIGALMTFSNKIKSKTKNLSLQNLSSQDLNNLENKNKSENLYLPNWLMNLANKFNNQFQNKKEESLIIDQVSTSNTGLENLYLFNKGKYDFTLNVQDYFIDKNQNIIFFQKVKSEEDKNKGLSDKEILFSGIFDKSIEEKNKIVTEGMLFEFEKLGVYDFWMKDMKFDIDIIWLDENFKIVYLAKDVSKDSYNKENESISQIFANTKSSQAKYVLEINAGISNAINLKMGDKLELIEKNKI